jgi:hypothetical protein
MAMQAEQQFNEAFHRLQLEMPRIKKDGAVEYKGKEAFKFATWEAIDAVIRPILQREGFSLSFDSAQRQGDGGGIVVTGKLSHTGGAHRTASIPVPLDTSGGKNAIQGYGSAMSYGRRYTATALLNIVTEGEDDSGVRGGVKFIDEVRLAQITALIVETKSDRNRLMQHYQIAELHNLTAEQEPHLMKVLLGKLSPSRRTAWDAALRDGTIATMDDFPGDRP